jgi:hypothetical protein
MPARIATVSPVPFLMPTVVSFAPAARERQGVPYLIMKVQQLVNEERLSHRSRWVIAGMASRPGENHRYPQS